MQEIQAEYVDATADQSPQEQLIKAAKLGKQGLVFLIAYALAIIPARPQRPSRHNIFFFP